MLAGQRSAPAAGWSSRHPLRRDPWRDARAEGALPPGRAAAKRLRRPDVGRREHRLSRASIGTRSRPGRRWSAAARCAGGAQSLIAEYGIRTPGARRADRQPVGRQRAARGAGARAVRRRDAADRLEPLLRARLRGGGGDSLASDGGAQPRRGRAAHQRRPGRDLRASDRIVVISEGKAVHETPIAAADLGSIGRHMAGHA